MRASIGGLIMSLFLIMGVENATAQRRGPSQQQRMEYRGESLRHSPMGDRRARVEEMIRERFNSKVRKELNLTEEQHQRLEEILTVFHEQRLELSEKSRNIRRQMIFLGSGSEDGFSEDKYNETLHKMIEIREEELQLLREEQSALSELISSRQILRYLVIREELKQRMDNIRKGGDSRYPRGRGMDRKLW